ncbi:MAG: hypothetical protein PHX44_04925 [Sulfurimonas sp.]|uniref:hypothetical protein n=1 Tax=Sulfurimonas sp. TaxID=2022749 RepID=UPI00260EA101|nr:hypothetical protein [Sulfurimonas sp.]MDD2652378.1 hypothetical protein [Sulfurimonas sp.]MDD3451146.1 hypothetical protein [Sulfurimonas sp.]
MKEMFYHSKIGVLDLSKVTRLYPAAVVDAHGEVAEMSLEWADMNTDKVKIVSYVLVFDFTPSGEKVREKKELLFETKEALFEAMQEVAQFF